MFVCKQLDLDLCRRFTHSIKTQQQLLSVCLCVLWSQGRRLCANRSPSSCQSECGVGGGPLCSFYLLPSNADSPHHHLLLTPREVARSQAGKADDDSI